MYTRAIVSSSERTVIYRLSKKLEKKGICNSLKRKRKRKKKLETEAKIKLRV